MQLDKEGKTVVVIGPLPNDLVSRVFLTKPDERGNMKRVRVVELINKLKDDLEKDSLQCTFNVEFEKNTTSNGDTHLNNIMSYNNILDYVERKHNNKDGNLWKLISGKKGKDDEIKIQVLWETGTTYTECFETSKNDIPVNLAIYAKNNNLLELNGWNKLKQLVNRSKLTG